MEYALYDKCETGINEKIFERFYNSKNEPYIWHHKKYKFDMFKNYTYYQHCDLRKQIKHERKLNNAYLFDAQTFLNKPEVTKEFNGVKGIWFEHRLPYVKMEDTVNWDPMHILKNIGDRTMDVWSGERFSEKVIKFCKDIEVHPDFDIGINQPWSISEKNIKNKV
jgi:hypothetical protein